MARTLAITFLAAFSAATATAEDKAVKIPLKEIWALDMSGTRDIAELPAQNAAAEQSLDGIRKSLAGDHIADSIPKRGFAVAALAKDALLQAHTVLAKGEKPRYRFTENDQLSLVFFSREFGSKVQLAEVVREGGTVTLRYQLVPHKTDNSTAHFALIPIGKLRAGKYHVRVEPQSVDTPSTESSDEAKSVVCDSFYLAIDEGPAR